MQHGSRKPHVSISSRNAFLVCLKLQTQISKPETIFSKKKTPTPTYPQNTHPHTTHTHPHSFLFFSKFQLGLLRELATKEVQEAEQALRVAQDELAKATAEVGALAAQRASGAVRAASLVDSPNEAPPGFIREDYATSLWLEREQNIQSLIAEAVATALARQQGQSSAAPSEAPTDDAPNFSELGSIDHFADDDSSWAKLDKGKRKALVNRDRAEMAGKLKTTILKRVVKTEPPFKVARKQSHEM